MKSGMVTAETNPMSPGPATPPMKTTGMATPGASKGNALAKKFAMGSTAAQSRSGKPPNKVARKDGQKAAIKGL